MRLLHSVLARLKQTKKPQDKFVTHWLRLLLMLPGHAPCRNMSRDRPYHERTVSRWYGRKFDGVSRNKGGLTEVVPPEPEQALGIDASLVPNSGKHTYGLDRFWNGSHSRADKGRDISTLAWLDLTDHCAYGLSVEQTPPSAETSDPEPTRMDVSLDPLSRVVQAPDVRFLRYVITDGAYRKQQFVAGVRALELPQIGKVRADAHLRYLYQGPKRPGPGRPKTYDGQVNWNDLSRFERLETEDEHIVLDHQVLHHVPLQRNLQVVVVLHTQRHRYVVRFSTAVDLDPLTLYHYYKARFQIEFLLRDAKQFTGLSDCQARSQATLDFHFHASVSAGTFAKLEARHQNGNGDQAFSMARLKRRAFTQHLVDRICEHLAKGQSLEKSSPDYEALCNYGIIADEAA